MVKINITKLMINKATLTVISYYKDANILFKYEHRTVLYQSYNGHT